MDISNSSNIWNEKLIAPEKDSKFLLSELCRLCGIASRNLISIYEGEGLENDLGGKIEKHLPVRLLENNHLPQRLCYHCANTVIAWHDITENILKVDDKFRTILEEMGYSKKESCINASEIVHLPAFEFDGNEKQTSFNNSVTEEINVPSRIEITRLSLTSDSDCKPTQQKDFEWHEGKCDSKGVEDNSISVKLKAISNSTVTDPANECAKCESNFNDKELIAHLAENHLDSIYRCHTCNTCCRTKVELLNHIKSEHNVVGVSTDCHVISPPERNQNAFDGILPADHSYCADTLRKEEKENQNGDFVCGVCGNSFSRKQDLRRHVAGHTWEDSASGAAPDATPDAAPDAPDAVLWAPSETKEAAAAAATVAERGAETGMGTRTVMVEAKTQKASAPSEGTAHAVGRKAQKAQKAPQVFECGKCGRRFASKDSRARHHRIHSGERPYTCDACGKQFRDAGGLRRHLRDVHHRIKSFGCDLCGRFFASKATRDDHRRVHTGERPFVCHRCGKAFKSKASLYIHSKIHSDSFPHPCSYCDKSFRRKQELANHLTTHTGEKPHVCEVCGKSFGVRGEMLRHKVTHSDDRPFACATCGLGFKQKRYLRNHEKTHRKNGNA